MNQWSVVSCQLSVGSRRGRRAVFCERGVESNRECWESVFSPRKDAENGGKWRKMAEVMAGGVFNHE